MKVISATEARKRFPAITDEVRQGKISYSIVRHGKEVARLMPPSDAVDLKISPNLKKELAAVFARYDEAFRELAKR